MHLHSFFAMLDVEAGDRTTCCILVDKEEIGSVGATGMHSRFFENAVAEILALMGETADIKVRRALQNSKMLSSDECAATIRCLQKPLRREVQHFSEKDLYLISSQEATERADPTMPMQNILHRSARH